MAKPCLPDYSNDFNFWLILGGRTRAPPDPPHLREGAPAPTRPLKVGLRPPYFLGGMGGAEPPTRMGGSGGGACAPPRILLILYLVLNQEGLTVTGRCHGLVKKASLARRATVRPWQRRSLATPNQCQRLITGNTEYMGTPSD